jgi:hypothetical protein
MVRVIEKKEEAGAEECVELHVYDSANVVYGKGFHGARNGQNFVGTNGDTSVDEEFKRVMTYAVHYGIPFVWIDDPAGLFPADRRKVGVYRTLLNKSPRPSF